MNTSTEHIHIAKIQNKIAQHLGLSAEKVIFEYREDGPETVLNLITINPVHEQSFLYKSVRSGSKMEALDRLLEYIESTHERENSYTIQWSQKDEDALHTSYFRGSNIPDVLDKFLYGRDLNATTIYSITLNPIS